MNKSNIPLKQKRTSNRIRLTGYILEGSSNHKRYNTIVSNKEKGITKTLFLNSLAIMPTIKRVKIGNSGAL